MTEIKFFKKNNEYFKIEAVGHTGYAQHGNDILCASVSSIIQLGALGFKNVLKLKPQIKKREKDGYILVELPTNQNLSKAQVLFETMLEGLKDLEKGYSGYIKLEVIDYVY